MTENQNREIDTNNTSTVNILVLSKLIEDYQSQSGEVSRITSVDQL